MTIAQKDWDVQATLSAEQFCLDVRRRQILSIGEKSLKQIVAEQLRIWGSESRAQRPEVKGGGDAHPTSAPTSRA